MTRRDSALVLVLVASLALVAALVGAPILQPAASRQPTAPPVVTSTDRPYREGVLGHPQSISPLTARTQADRDLVALLFSGLVRNGADGTLVPDLAAQWSVDEEGTTWTFQIRDDAAWHDGTPVTAQDVVFTIQTLQDPRYEGPRAASWVGVTVKATGERTVRFTLETPLGGFLQAATQPIAPAHLLASVQVAQLPQHSFGQEPIGSGPFALESLESDLARLRPAAGTTAGEPATSGGPVATDSLATAGPTIRPSGPRPYIDGIEFHYYESADALAADYAAGLLDGASGIDPGIAAAIAEPSNSRLVRYPGSTLTAVLFNLRPGHPAFATAAVRTALLQALDRDGLVNEVFEEAAERADSLIPPSSPWFDPKASPAVEFDPPAAEEALLEADWKRVDGAWRLPGEKHSFKVELLSPDEASNPVAYATAAAVARDWSAFGIDVTHTPLPAGEFVSERLTTGEYDVAVADLAIGLDPDLYPLLASSQTLSGGSNVMGIQDATLDELLAAARKPGPQDERAAAYRKLQEQLTAGRYLLPLAFADETIVLHSGVSGPVARQVSDPSDRFWDVLTWRLADDR